MQLTIDGTATGASTDLPFRIRSRSTLCAVQLRTVWSDSYEDVREVCTVAVAALQDVSFVISASEY